jgi:hypothetical protein
LKTHVPQRCPPDDCRRRWPNGYRTRLWKIELPASPPPPA